MSARARFLAAARCEEVDRPPLWLMRQAGRYLPEYRKLKERYDFLTLAQTPELAAEVTLQPLARFPLDAAIIFSDILVIPEALGQPYRFREQGGITLDFAIDSPAQLQKLSLDALEERLAYVPAALRLVKKDLGERAALLGFCGSPWTLAAYMLEGGPSNDFAKARRLFYEESEVFRQLLELLTRALIRYLRMQIEAGADAIQIFDSCASHCSWSAYEGFSLRWIRRLIAGLPPEIPIIVFARGMSHRAFDLTSSGASVIALDHGVDLPETSLKLPEDVAVQGNLDPILMAGPREPLRRATRDLLLRMQTRRGFILNLGHGMIPSANPDNVQLLTELVREVPSA